MKNSQKGFVVPLLLAIIAVLVIGGGIYIYSNKKTETPILLPTGTEGQMTDKIQQQTNTPTPPVTTQTNNSNSSSISNWKTYTNTQYGFSLKYPSNWLINSQNSDVVRVELVDNKWTPYEKTSNRFLVRNIGDLDLNYLRGGTLANDAGWTNMSVGTSPTGASYGSEWQRFIYFQPNNINVAMWALDVNTQTIENQILSTFKFTK